MLSKNSNFHFICEEEGNLGFINDADGRQIIELQKDESDDSILQHTKRHAYPADVVMSAGGVTVLRNIPSSDSNRVRRTGDALPSYGILLRMRW